MVVAMLDASQVYDRLKRVMSAEAARELADIIGAVAEERRQAVTKVDFNELKEIVRDLALAQQELAQAQKRTEERVEELAQAQKRTEERVEELAQAQKRTEERVEELALAQQELAQAQKRTEETLRGLMKQVGGLSDAIGGDIEDIAYIVLHDVLKRELGWKVGVLQRTWQTWNKEPEEVNIFGQAFDPARPDATIWIVGEAKHNLTVREVDRFIKQLARARRHLGGEIFPVCFCYRARPEVQEMIKANHINLVFSYGRLERARP